MSEETVLELWNAFAQYIYKQLNLEEIPQDEIILDAAR